MSGYEPSPTDAFLILWLAKTVLRPYYARHVRRLGLRGHERVLDFGCGPGVAARQIAAQLAKGGGRLTCVDVSQTWMRVARQMTRRCPNVEYKLGDIAALDVEDDAYDVVFIHFVLHDIPARDRPQIVRHLADKLQVGGRLSLREPTSSGHGMSPGEIRRLMTGAGLGQVSLETGRAMCIQPICDGVFRALDPPRS
jgi:2-polyprenyl-3-methyl-5-hydroxy-6-metoxy-1,4-benzoquinol methylase